MINNPILSPLYYNPGIRQGAGLAQGIYLPAAQHGRLLPTDLRGAVHAGPAARGGGRTPNLLQQERTQDTDWMGYTM